HGGRSGHRGQAAQDGQRASQQQREPGQQPDERRVVDVAPGQVAPAVEKVQLVAEITVAVGQGQVDQELEAGQGQEEGSRQAWMSNRLIALGRDHGRRQGTRTFRGDMSLHRRPRQGGSSKCACPPPPCCSLSPPWPPATSPPWAPSPRSTSP